MSAKRKKKPYKGLKKKDYFDIKLTGQVKYKRNKRVGYSEPLKFKIFAHAYNKALAKRT